PRIRHAHSPAPSIRRSCCPRTIHCEGRACFPSHFSQAPSAQKRHKTNSTVPCFSPYSSARKVVRCSTDAAWNSLARRTSHTSSFDTSTRPMLVHSFLAYHSPADYEAERTNRCSGSLTDLSTKSGQDQPGTTCEAPVRKISRPVCLPIPPPRRRCLRGRAIRTSVRPEHLRGRNRKTLAGTYAVGAQLVVPAQRRHRRAVALRDSR
ncbi:MAG: hypothetical protein H6Q33_5291, partial [Deltaproteobacteria bacterium]|nr:hypothetical protein [Deltaproteobacteria bacterium]